MLTPGCTSCQAGSDRLDTVEYVRVRGCPQRGVGKEVEHARVRPTAGRTWRLGRTLQTMYSSDPAAEARVFGSPKATNATTSITNATTSMCTTPRLLPLPPLLPRPPFTVPRMQPPPGAAGKHRPTAACEGGIAAAAAAVFKASLAACMGLHACVVREVERGWELDLPTLTASA